MIKKSLLIIALFLFGCENNTLVRSGNLEQKPLKFDFKTTRDADCGMVVAGLKFSAQVIAEDGRTWFFHDPGGVAKFLDGKDFAEKSVLWFYTMDSERWLRSEDVFFSTYDETPMGYGFAAYEFKQDGLITYEEMVLKMLRGENMTNPALKKKHLEQH